MSGVLILIAALALATAYGLWHRASRGRIKEVNNVESSPLLKVLDSMGERATLVQFSSAFCAPCRATKLLLTEIAARNVGIEHVEIDAESKLELLRELRIRSTPTTLILDRTGREVGRAVGAPKREQVLAALAALN